ncbi:60S acidic ribosomal protein P2 [Mycoemilia scoparia]|uniref:60S acidic ribosomal protein P2 n=1 Tax=Mycoemilia scoparia TaxID=417184 RepID=A0A9W8A4M3_9FUNG|nr:60S acidic ribosomal protein P2 [Mycoemilia scoparia]
MRYLAAYLLLQQAGVESPALADIEKVITSVGIDFDSSRAEKVIAELSGKNIDELIAQGQSKLASVPSAGAVAAGGAAAAGGAEAAAEEQKAEEEEEESDDDMGFGLFD